MYSLFEYICYIPFSNNMYNILLSYYKYLYWKLANIIPIFKKGDHSLPSNYRQISLLPSTLIIFEKNIIALSIILFKI